MFTRRAGSNFFNGVCAGRAQARNASVHCVLISFAGPLECGGHLAPDNMSRSAPTVFASLAEEENLSSSCASPAPACCTSTFFNMAWIVLDRIVA